MITEEKPKTLMDWELEQHKSDLFGKVTQAIDEYLRFDKSTEIRIICGEYEAVIKRSEL